MFGKIRHNGENGLWPVQAKKASKYYYYLSFIMTSRPVPKMIPGQLNGNTN
jgi:hypothetical protein